mmetsp:Transcript_25616/g.63116  ORF Transcript_25616/g.63116 Transcript_25616/m.63116 type:complete len:84 (-) Transcript_25616:131-382(-)
MGSSVSIMSMVLERFQVAKGEKKSAVEKCPESGVSESRRSKGDKELRGVKQSLQIGNQSMACWALSGMEPGGNGAAFAGVQRR